MLPRGDPADEGRPAAQRGDAHAMHDIGIVDDAIEGDANLQQEAVGLDESMVQGSQG